MFLSHPTKGLAKFSSVAHSMQEPYDHVIYNKIIFFKYAILLLNFCNAIFVVRL